MLELIRRDALHRIANKFKIASKEVARHIPKARKEVEKSCIEAQQCYSVLSTGGKYEIVESENGYSVSLSRYTYACRKWDLTGIPRRHAVCAIQENKLDVENFISDYYLTEKWQETYMRELRPVNGPKFWSKVFMKLHQRVELVGLVVLCIVVYVEKRDIILENVHVRETRQMVYKDAQEVAEAHDAPQGEVQESL